MQNGPHFRVRIGPFAKIFGGPFGKIFGGPFGEIRSCVKIMKFITLKDV